VSLAIRATRQEESSVGNDAQLEKVDQYLQVLLIHAQDSMGEQGGALAGTVRAIQAEYDRAVLTLADDQASKDAKNYAKAVTDSIGKNLPNLTKGVLTAASAFQKGDYINGSAAIMDICAAGVQMLGSLSAGAGPYGAVFGAVFTIIGQLLTFFGPKQPSLKDQIVEAMRGLNAEVALQHTEANYDEVEEYATTIYRMRPVLLNHLKVPLAGDAIDNMDAAALETYLDGYQTNLVGDLTQITGAFDKVSNLYDKWTTKAWLKESKNQGHEKWPEILGIFCRTYADSMAANAALASLAHMPLLDKRMVEASVLNPRYKENNGFKEIHNLVIKLKAKAHALPDLWNDGNKQMLDFLIEIKPVARHRGLYVFLGFDQNLYGATGRSSLEAADWTKLQSGYEGRGRRFAVTAPKGSLGSLKPTYDLFVCQQWLASYNGDFEHGRVTPSPVKSFDMTMMNGEKAWSDVWSLPKDGETSWVYTTTNDPAETTGSIKLFELDQAKNEVKIGNWWPQTKAGVVNVRAVTPPAKPLPEDPDGDAMPTNLMGGADHYCSIVYAALRSSPEICVSQANQTCYVPAPWAVYTGIDVDPYYVWAFRPQGLACATHASVLSCIQGKRPTPRWMEHSPGVLGDQSTHDGSFWWVNNRETMPAPPLVGLTSLSACKDGTLLANIYKRTVDRLSMGDHFAFEAHDDPAVHTASFSIDLKAGALNVDSWSKWGGKALQVQKMPISCWSLFESLDVDLRGKLNPLQVT